MKTSAKAVACLFFLVVLLTVSCVSRQTTENEQALVKNELEGVWKIIGDTTVYPPDMNRETEVNETHLPGIMIFTKKYFSWVDFYGDSLPELPKELTDAQMAAVYKQLTAVAGTYEIKGSSITVPIIVSTDPNELSGGEPFHFEYVLEGDVLSMSWTEENQVNVTLKLKRLE